MIGTRQIGAVYEVVYQRRAKKTNNLLWPEVDWSEAVLLDCEVAALVRALNWLRPEVTPQADKIREQMTRLFGKDAVKECVIEYLDRRASWRPRPIYGIALGMDLMQKERS